MAESTRTRMVAPRQERARQSRDRIFQAAVDVFADKGPAGARIEEIAQRAEVNKQRIYAYFGSKDALYREVLIEVYSWAADNQRLLALGESDIPAMTRVIVDTFFQIHEERPSFWRLLCWENLNGGRSLHATDWQQIRSAYISHLERLYRVGQERGVFRADVHFFTYIMLLFAATYFYFSNQVTLSNLLNLDLSSGAVRQRIEGEVLAMLTAGVCTPGAGVGMGPAMPPGNAGQPPGASPALPRNAPANPAR